MKKRMSQGSMTVEAVFVMTVLLVILMWIMLKMITMHQQTVETAEVQWIEIKGAADRFRVISFGKELVP